MSTRGLFVGGKSTGNTNRQQGRRTAPAAMNQAAGTPVDPPDIEAPALSPQASMQAAVLTAERQDTIKRIQFPSYVAPPEPNSDLRALAKSLGGFSDSLGTLVDTGIKFEKAENERAKLHAEALAAQGFAYGPFADYAELTRNLEKVKEDTTRSEQERQRAELLLNELKARANRIRPHIDSQARILQVRQNAMSLSVEAAKNPVIGQNENGTELRLHDLSADDPRYTAWQNNYIYGDVPLTPAEFKEVRGIVQQATINDMSRQNTQKVKRDEAMYVQSHAQRMNELGYQHFMQSTNQTPLDTKRAMVQALIDEPRFMALSPESQKKVLDAMFKNYLAGAKRAGAAKYNIDKVQEVFYSSDDETGVESGVYVGPLLQREKADGTPNTALLWRYTQSADWKDQTELEEESQGVRQRDNQLKVDLQEANAKYKTQFDEILDALDGATTRTYAEAKLKELNEAINQDESLDPGVKFTLKQEFKKRFDLADENTYGQLYDATNSRLRGDMNDVTNEVLTEGEMRKRIEDEYAAGNLRRGDYIRLLEGLDKVKDPVVVTAARGVSASVTRYEKDLKERIDGDLISPEEEGVVRAGLAQMKREFAELGERRARGEIDDITYQEEAAKIVLNPAAARLLRAERTFDSHSVSFKDYDVDPVTGMSKGASPAMLNRQLKDNFRNGQNPFRRIHASSTERAFGFNALFGMSRGLASNGKESYGYDYNKFKKLVEKAGVDPLDFLIREHNKAIRIASLYTETPEDQKRLEQLRVSLSMLQEKKASQTKQASALDPQRTAAKLATARDTSRNFLDLLLFPSAAAATMELPPPQPPAQIAVRPAAPVGNVRIGDGSKQQSVASAAKRVGIHPVYLAAVMSLETGGTFDPRARNSLGYVGLIQFGAWEQKNYRVSRNTPFEDQAAAAAQFLIDRGVKPGDGIDRIYAAVLIGNADGKLADGSDGMKTKDAYGTSVMSALKRLSPGGGHYNNAVRFLRGG